MPPVTDNAPQNQDQPANEGSPVPLQQFKVRLFQVAEVNTEVFDVQATDEADALAQGQELIANKDLENVQHRLEAEVVTPPEPVSDPNESLGSTADTPTADTTSPHAADNTTGENNAPLNADQSTDPNSPTRPTDES